MSPHPNTYRSMDDRPYDSFHLLVETTLAHPVSKVWPHALNIRGWMSAHRLETIAGAPGEVGHLERVYPHGLGSEVPQPHYHLYGVAEIIPQKLIMLEVFPEKGGSYGKTREKLSFDAILLTDLGSATKVAFLMVDVHLGPGSAQYTAQRRDELEGVRSMLDRYFENLARLVEGG
jgi:hypothetical protein